MRSDPDVHPRRCAVYTRKSSSEGLDQAFNSLDAQRQAGESYIASQSGLGWTLVEKRYDDGGYSGGSLDRPAIKRLMADIEAGEIDVVVVYKIDRLSRSLLDFAAMIGRFEARGVAFVAVTQSFDTTSSMGRLTLNVLLSFAQFERELTSERLRDKFAASRAKGLWLHGRRPYGYRVEKGVLTVDEAEAEVIRELFRRYPKVGSANLLAEELTARGIYNKVGRPFSKRTLANLLHNRLYLGELTHRGESLPGIHQAIVTESAWAKAQAAMAESGRRRAALKRAPIPSLLKGLVFGPSGHAMVHTFLHSRGRLYRYYVASNVHRYGVGSDPTGRFRAHELEECTLAAVEALLPSAPRRWTAAEAAGAVRRLVKRIDIGHDDMVITLSTGAVLRTAVSGRIGKVGPSLLSTAARLASRPLPP